MNKGNGDGDGAGLKAFYAYKNTFDEGSVWVDVPKQVTFVNLTDPYNEPSSPEPEPLVDTPATHSHSSFEPYVASPWQGSTHHNGSPSVHGLQALSAAASSMVDPPTSQPGSANSHNLNFILNPTISSPASLPVDPDLRSPSCPAQTRNYGARSASLTFSQVSHGTDHVNHGPETQHELAYLLRYFSEGPGLWMDLFDLGLYFSSYVPAKSLTNPLLKYAAVACAAKALGRIRGQKPTFGGNASYLARTEVFPDTLNVDWFHKATGYYDIALPLLREALQGQAPARSPEPADDPRNKRRRLSSLPPSRADSDEVLAATAILSVYEFLDASGPEWSRHLNGAKSLLDIAKDGMMPLQLPSPGNLHPHVTGLTKARKATFWNFARQDMLAAFIDRTRTRLDTEDLPVWRDAGLLLDDDGFIQASNTTRSGYPEGAGMIREDMTSNALIWLMSKLVNFLAAGEDSPLVLDRPGHGVSQKTLLEYWQHLYHQFRAWYDGLPITFKPCVEIGPSRIGEAETTIPETWYSIPMCASTMQSYHMAQVQLLINKPHESTQKDGLSVYDRAKSYSDSVLESQRHSRQIVGIALSRPEASVRIHSVQPLYTAGQLLLEESERRLVLKLLRDIEKDTGWATEYRVRHLLEKWGWTDDGAEGVR
ncbi:hypothetical protein H2201_005283 [Coniosporium apollinis]|uniref:Transcription factor domain-containing protein n=1 Tax=Coniosporium apollinis TaxID=61459 RepID=A0ABQ9NQE8_9PEZI|nr:hypothetical protein H2201_005283 [Coniosporium apollinis]